MNPLAITPKASEELELVLNVPVSSELKVTEVVEPVLDVSSLAVPNIAGEPRDLTGEFGALDQLGCPLEDGPAPRTSRPI